VVGWDGFSIGTLARRFGLWSALVGVVVQVVLLFPLILNDLFVPSLKDWTLDKTKLYSESTPLCRTTAQDNDVSVFMSHRRDS
jgi:hypothetical protein